MWTGKLRSSQTLSLDLQGPADETKENKMSMVKRNVQKERIKGSSFATNVATAKEKENDRSKTRAFSVVVLQKKLIRTSWIS